MLSFVDSPHSGIEAEVETEESEELRTIIKKENTFFPVDLPEYVNPKKRNRISDIEKQVDNYWDSIVDAAKKRFQWHNDAEKR